MKFGIAYDNTCEIWRYCEIESNLIRGLKFAMEVRSNVRSGPAGAGAELVQLSGKIAGSPASPVPEMGNSFNLI